MIGSSRTNLMKCSSPDFRYFLRFSIGSDSRAMHSLSFDTNTALWRGRFVPGQIIDSQAEPMNHFLNIMSPLPSDEPRTSTRGAAVLGAFVVAIVAMMIVPLPTPLLDVLITLNLALSVALLL